MDDQPLVLNLLERILTAEGYEVRKAIDGEEGLRFFGSDSWSLVITDRDMPKMDGEAMAKAIRLTHSNVPIILATGTSTIITHRPMFHAVIEKPFTRQMLLAVIEPYLQRADEQSSAPSRASAQM